MNQIGVVMETYDEWYYAELLEMIRNKEAENNRIQIELELPIQQTEDKKEIETKKDDERGVFIIDYSSSEA